MSELPETIRPRELRPLPARVSAQPGRRSCRSARRRSRWPRSSGRGSGWPAIASISPAVARDVGRHAGAAGDLAERARALNEIILLKHGYSGDELTYDDLQNANLMRVIDRRKGLPVALGILICTPRGPRAGTRRVSAFPVIS